MDIITIDTLDQKLPTLKDKYKLVKSSDLIDKIIGLGYTVDSFTALKTKKIERRGYQKHRVLFSSKELLTTSFKDEGKLQLLMTNSHDGTSSVTFQLGFFRYICANGLVAGQLVGEPIRVRHIGNIDKNIEEAVERIVARANVLDEALGKLKSKTLNNDELNKFELEASKLRFDNVIKAEFPLLRNEDNGNGLFEVFNRVQEGLIKGGAIITNDKGQTRRARRLTSFVRDNDVNSRLFDLALSFVA
jgi:hypothetical protein